MKRTIVCLLLVFIAVVYVRASQLSERIKSLPNVISVEELEVIPFFSEKYLVLVKQPVDHKDLSKGSFSQRVFLSHRGFDRPMVMITEGYNANYAAQKKYKNELCDILDANQICIEHRYFAESKPDSLDWQYLTTENAAGDHHAVNTMFKTIYKSKWVATGISKGGQTCILYKAYYPNDVDVTVPYVAPVNFGVEDGRHEPFIGKKISNRCARKKVLKFQKELLKRRIDLKDEFEDFVDKNNYTFKVSLDSVYDLCVLEYAFAFWQWGTNPKKIPSARAEDSTVFKHFIDVASPDYFSNEGSQKYLSFFVQAGHELGYYGYDTKPFQNSLVMKDAHGYLQTVFLDGVYEPEWKPTLEWANTKVQKDGNNMLFIYGEDDPWSAPAYTKGERNDQLVIFKPHGSHKARINNLPPRLRKKAVETLKAWMK